MIRHLPSNHSVDSDINLDKENINKYKEYSGEYYNDLPGKSPPVEEIQVRLDHSPRFKNIQL